MLKKKPPITIDPNSPFALDRLGRSESIKNLTQLVESATDPLVISVGGAWGTGKTTFATMWRYYLEQRGFPCAMINAWTSDYHDEPMIAITGEMQRVFDDIGRQHRNASAIRTAWKKTRDIGAAVIANAAPIGVRLGLKAILGVTSLKEIIGDDTSEDIIKAVTAEIDKRIANYDAERMAISAFRDRLADLVKTIQVGESPARPMVVFIDELDRCRPSYALLMLERLKHFFSVPGTIFVISIDRSQLGNAIRAVYGDEIDTDGYLRRFFDFEFRLPEASRSQYCEHLATLFGLKELLSGRKDATYEYRDFVREVAQLADMFEFSLRTLDQVYSQIVTAIKITPTSYKLLSLSLAFLVALRNGRPVLYDDYRRGRIGAAAIMNEIKKLPYGAKLNESHAGVVIETYLILWSKIPGESNDAKKRWREKHQDTVDPLSDRDSAMASVWALAYRDDEEDLGDYIFNKLEFTAAISK